MVFSHQLIHWKFSFFKISFVPSLMQWKTKYNSLEVITMLPQKNFCPIVSATTYIWILNSRQTSTAIFFSLPISLSLKQFYDCRVQRGLIKLSFLVLFSLKKYCKNYQTFAQNSPVLCQAQNVSGMNKNQPITNLRFKIFTSFFDKARKVFS